MAIISSAAAPNYLTIDATSKAMRASYYNSLGREVNFGTPPAFACTIQNIGGVANPVDIFTITGSMTKVVRVVSFVHCTTVGASPATNSYEFRLLKRFSVNYTAPGGAEAPAPIPGVSLDSRYAPTAICEIHVANPNQTGGLMGNMHIKRTATMPLVPGVWATLAAGLLTFGNGDNAVEMIPHQRYQLVDQEVTLRGRNEMLCLNGNAVTIATSQQSWISVLWTESDV